MMASTPSLPELPELQALQTLRHALTSLQQSPSDLGSTSITHFCRCWRQQLVLFTTLPTRYAEVAENLLSRLESGSLFTEESCSFSQQDLLDNLATWISKAEQQIALSGTASSAKIQQA